MALYDYSHHFDVPVIRGDECITIPILSRDPDPGRDLLESGTHHILVGYGKNGEMIEIRRHLLLTTEDVRDILTPHEAEPDEGEAGAA